MPVRYLSDPELARQSGRPDEIAVPRSFDNDAELRRAGHRPLRVPA